MAHFWYTFTDFSGILTILLIFSSIIEWNYYINYVNNINCINGFLFDFHMQSIQYLSTINIFTIYKTKILGCNNVYYIISKIKILSTNSAPLTQKEALRFKVPGCFRRPLKIVLKILIILDFLNDHWYIWSFELGSTAKILTTEAYYYTRVS